MLLAFVRSLGEGGLRSFTSDGVRLKRIVESDADRGADGPNVEIEEESGARSLA